MTLSEAISLINNGLTRPKGPVRWADLGCGEGLFTLALASLLPAGSVIYGVDKNNPLKKQTTAGGVDIIPISADFVTDPLPLNNLDGLLMANYLPYWDYTHVDTLLTLQNPKTDFPDEVIFIIYHQVTELYFKLCLIQ